MSLKWMRLKHLPQSEKQLTKRNKTDAGYDICANVDFVVPAGGSAVVGTGIAIKVPESPFPDMEYHVQFWPRSGLSVNKKIETGAGIGDKEYRGEYKLHLYNNSRVPVQFKAGDRVAQIVVVLCYTGDVEEVDELDVTNRGESGFGSSGIQ